MRVNKFFLIVSALSLLLLIIIISGCAVQQSGLVCTGSYINAFDGVNNVCCLDANHDDICDSGTAVKAQYATYEAGQKNDPFLLENLSKQKAAEKEAEDQYNVNKVIVDQRTTDRQHAEDVIRETNRS